MDVVVNDTDGRWHQYLQAVYQGRALMPFRVSRLRFIYSNSPAWRHFFVGVASPFRDCLDDAQPRCSRCQQEWAQHAPRTVATVADAHLWINTFRYRRSPPNLPGALLYAKKGTYGHALQPARRWVEVMRHRTTSAEGMKTFFYKGFEGCFFRPAPGSGIWINTGFTFDAQKDARLETVITRAITEGYDTVQWSSVSFDDDAPMLTVTRPPCHRLDAATNPGGLGTCLPAAIEVRAGWHDIQCECSEELSTLNCFRRVLENGSVSYESGIGGQYSTAQG